MFLLAIEYIQLLTLPAFLLPHRYAATLCAADAAPALIQQTTTSVQYFAHQLDQLVDLIPADFYHSTDVCRELAAGVGWSKHRQELSNHMSVCFAEVLPTTDPTCTCSRAQVIPALLDPRTDSARLNWTKCVEVSSLRRRALFTASRFV